MRKLLFFVLILPLTGVTAKSQDTAAESTFTETAYQHAVSFYHRFTDKNARLYKGIHHLGYSHRIEGIAYYPTNTWQKGTVWYDGIRFDDVNMMYDAYQDELVIQHFSRLMLTLHNEKVKEFRFSGSRFIRVVRDSLSNMPLKTGFYEVLYEGGVTLLARRNVTMEETVTDQVEQRFILKHYYHLQKNGEWHAVKSYKDLTTILKEHAKEIRQHLKKNKIKFRKDRETAIRMAVQHFDALTR